MIWQKKKKKGVVNDIWSVSLCLYSTSPSLLPTPSTLSFVFCSENWHIHFSWHPQVQSLTDSPQSFLKYFLDCKFSPIVLLILRLPLSSFCVDVFLMSTTRLKSLVTLKSTVTRTSHTGYRVPVFRHPGLTIYSRSSTSRNDTVRSLKPKIGSHYFSVNLLLY